jgi:1-acyl-sn-glycerol-3-phosphate acyltransferase
MIPIDRRGGSDVVTKMRQTAQTAVAAGRKIVIFPQGTRTRPGVDRPYKGGVATLYETLGLQVVPMALNSGLLWPKGSFIKKPGLITIEFLPPIPPGLPRGEFLTRLKSELETVCDRLAEKPN